MQVNNQYWSFKTCKYCWSCYREADTLRTGHQSISAHTHIHAVSIGRLWEYMGIYEMPWNNEQKCSSGPCSPPQQHCWGIFTQFCRTSSCFYVLFLVRIVAQVFPSGYLKFYLHLKYCNDELGCCSFSTTLLFSPTVQLAFGRKPELLHHQYVAAVFPQWHHHSHWCLSGGLMVA